MPLGMESRRHDRHRPGPAGAGPLDLDGEAAHLEPVRLSDGGQIGHFFHVAIADIDTGEDLAQWPELQ